VKKQRLFASAIEDERVAPLEPRDDLAFARLFRQQVADGLLRQGLWRCRPDVEQLGARACMVEQTRRNQMVMYDDVGGPQQLEAGYRNQARVSGPRADQINRRPFHG
jgi:hypothetical protein